MYLNHMDAGIPVVVFSHQVETISRYYDFGMIDLVLSLSKKDRFNSSLFPVSIVIAGFGGKILTIVPKCIINYEHM